MSARTMTEATPFEHKVVPRHTDFRMPAEMTDMAIQDVYAALVSDSARNAMIAGISDGPCRLDVRRSCSRGARSIFSSSQLK